MHLHHAEHRLAVGSKALEGPHSRGQFGAGAVGGAVQDGSDRAAQPPASIAVVGEPVGHQQAAEIGIAQPQRPEHMAVLGNPLRRIAGVVYEDFLGHEEDAAGRGKAVDIKRAIGPPELHQVDAGEIAGGVVEEHVLAAGVAGIDPAGVRAGVPAVDRGVVLHSRIAALPGALRHPAEHVAGFEGGPGLGGIGHPARCPGVVPFDGLHEVVGEAHREIGVLKQDRAVGLAIEVGVISPLLNQHASLVLLLRLAFDEFHHIGMGHFQRLHLGGTAGFAPALHHRRHLIVDAHEGERAGGLAAAGELFPLAAERGEVGAGAGAKLEEHRLAAGQLHDVFHVVLHALDEARAPLRIFVGVLRLQHFLGGLIPVPVAGGALHPVLMEQADVEPDRGVEGPMLMDAQPGEIAVEVFPILGTGEIAIRHAPIGDRAGHAVDQLANGMLPFWSVDFAVEILAHHHIGGQLAPRRRNFAGGLLKQNLAILPFDRRGAQLPFGGVKRGVGIDGTENRMHGQRLAIGGPRRGSRLGRDGGRGTCRGVKRCHGALLLA